MQGEKGAEYNSENEENTGIYSEEGREELQEEDTITNVDGGFMQGYEEEEKLAECGYCGNILEDDVVEKEIDGDLYRFCSRECVTSFERKRKG